jgi:hypothetical protein
MLSYYGIEILCCQTGHKWLPNHGPCALCSREETVDHSLLRCVVSREVWFKVLRKFGWQWLAPGPIPYLYIADWWLQLRKQIDKRRRRVFDSLIVLVAWRV